MDAFNNTDPHPPARKKQRTMEADRGRSRIPQAQERHGFASYQVTAEERSSHALGEAVAARDTERRHRLAPGQPAEREAVPKAGRQTTATKTAPENSAPGQENAADKQDKQKAERVKIHQSCPSKTPTDNKERCNLSRTAQSRHAKNDIKTKLRSLIPGPCKVSENGLMLQAAARIKELEREIDVKADHLERLQKLQRSNRVAGDELAENINYQSVPETSVSAIGQKTENGPEKLRDVLPQQSKANGSRLISLAIGYITELTEESDRIQRQIDEHHQGCSRSPKIDTTSSPDQQSSHKTSVSTNFGSCVGAQIMEASSVTSMQYNQKIGDSAEVHDAMALGQPELPQI